MPVLDRVGHPCSRNMPMKAEATGTIRKTDRTRKMGTAAPALKASSAQAISPIQGRVKASGSNQPISRLTKPM